MEVLPRCELSQQPRKGVKVRTLSHHSADRVKKNLSAPPYLCLPLPSEPMQEVGETTKASQVICGFTSTVNQFPVQGPKSATLGLNISERGAPAGSRV